MLMHWMRHMCPHGWLLRSLVEASFDLFRYLSLGDRLKQHCYERRAPALGGTLATYKEAFRRGMGGARAEEEVGLQSAVGQSHTSRSLPPTMLSPVIVLKGLSSADRVNAALDGGPQVAVSKQREEARNLER